MTATARFEGLARFLRERIGQGDSGKTFLVGLAGDAETFAIAAGVRGEQDQPHFLTFARYLLHDRFACDSYALLWPAEIEGEPIYVVEVSVADETVAQIVDPAGRCLPHPGGALMIEALQQRNSPLPGLQRRELDRLFAELQVPCPDARRWLRR